MMLDPYTYGTPAPLTCKSWEFNGIDEYISIGDVVTLGNGVTTQPFSIAANVNVNNFTNFIILSKSSSTNNLEWSLYFLPNGSAYFSLYDGTSSQNINIRSSLLSLGTDYNIIATSAGGAIATNTSLELYVDGINDVLSRGSGGTYVAFQDENAPIEIGRSRGIQYSNGKIQYVILFNKELSSAEALQVSSGDLTGLTGNIISAWYAIDSLDGVGGIVDSYGSNNGTFVNMTVADNVVDC